MLMDREVSSLLVVDVQKGLAPAICDGQRVVDSCAWLARMAVRLSVPVVVTEHFPDKIGHTVDAVRVAAGGASYVRKRFFSAHRDGCLVGTAIEHSRQVIMCGTEAHVCLQQTALELADAGKSIFVVADACGSRRTLDRDLAFERMRAHGIEIVSREMVAYEWLRHGEIDQFSQINRDFLREAPW